MAVDGNRPYFGPDFVGEALCRLATSPKGDDDDAAERVKATIEAWIEEAADSKSGRVLIDSSALTWLIGTRRDAKALDSRLKALMAPSTVPERVILGYVPSTQEFKRLLSAVERQLEGALPAPGGPPVSEQSVTPGVLKWIEHTSERQVERTASPVEEDDDDVDAIWRAVADAWLRGLDELRVLKSDLQLLNLTLESWVGE